MLGKCLRVSVAALVLSLTVISCGDKQDGAAKNVAPKALIVTAELSVLSDSDVMLDGSGSTDVDGDIVSYHWRQTAGTPITLVGDAASQLSFAAPPTDDEMLVTFSLTVTDNLGAQSTSDISINVVSNDFTVSYAFPGAGSRFKGDVIDVSGKVTTHSLLQATDMQVTVVTDSFEIIADVDIDGNWAATDVPVGSKSSVLKVIATDNKYNRVSSSQVSFGKHGIHFSNALMAVDKANDDIVYAFSPGPSVSQLIKINLATQEKILIYSLPHGPENTLAYVKHVEYDSSAQVMYLLYTRWDGAHIFAIDINSAQLSTISTNKIGAGPEYPPYSFNTMAIDTTRGIVYILDQQYKRLYGVDIASGDRTIVSDNSLIDAGPHLKSPNRIVIDESRNVAYLGDEGRLLRVDLTNGRRSIVTSSEVGAGELLPNFTLMAFDYVNNELIVRAKGGNVLFSINLDSGNRSKIAGVSVFDDSKRLHEVLFDGRKLRYLINDFVEGLANDTDTLFSIDVATGRQAIVFEDRVNAGPYLGEPRAITIDAVGEFAYVLDTSRPGIVKVDLNSGQRTVLFQVVNSEYTMRGLTLDEENNLVYSLAVTGWWPNQVTTVIEIDLATNAKAVLTNDKYPTGVELSGYQDIMFDKGENALFAIHYEDSLVIKVDLETLDSSIVASADVGDGELIMHPTGIAFDKVNKRLIVASEGTGATHTIRIIAIDIDSKKRQTLYSPDIGSGELINIPTSLALDSTGKYAYTFSAYSKFIRLDLDSAERTVVSGASQGNGVALSGISSIAISGDNNLLYATSYDLESLLLIDNKSGDRVILSK